MPPGLLGSRAAATTPCLHAVTYGLHCDHHIDHDQNPLPHGMYRVDVSISDPACPEQVHLTFADGVDEMWVLFVCRDCGKRVIWYGLLKENEEEWREVGTDVSTYEQKHMCDWPANNSVA